ncbi:MAG: hypothetical protein EHM39_13880 [Chloroflexi bacterium]|nr:MAG: hypothetical protein EHM39_13880 [Chloroflexota bacterium]
MRRTLFRTLRGFFIAIVIVLAFGQLFSLYTDSQLSQEKQDEVLIKAIPFVAVFVSIILAFACVIVLVAIGLGGRVPQRSYRPIEMIFMAGILLGVVGLFQGWKLFAYEYGFLLLLVSLLAFMVWSHMSPMSPGLSRAQQPLTRRAHLIAAAAGLIVWAAVGYLLISDVKPVAPYGYSPTVWSYMEPEEQEQIADDADAEYQNARVPVMLLFSLMPAAQVYFGIREMVPSQKPKPVLAPGASPTS